MGPSDSSHAASDGYVFPSDARGCPPACEVSQFPVLSVGTRHPFRPRGAGRLHTPATEASPPLRRLRLRRFIVRAGLVLSDGLAAPIRVTRLLWVRLRYGSHLGLPGLRVSDRSGPRPAGYMANGSFHGELLSIHKTKSVSLTHQRRGDAEKIQDKKLATDRKSDQRR